MASDISWMFSRFLRPSLPAKLVQDLLRRARAFGRPALRKSLVVGRAVLAGEEDVALSHLLVAGECGVLAHSPVGIGRAEIGIERGQRACGAGVPFGGSAGKNSPEAAEERSAGGAHGLWLRVATERRFLVAGVAGINRWSQPCASLIR